MGLVAHPLDQVQRLRTALQGDRQARARSVEQLFALGQGGELDLIGQSQRRGRLLGGVELREAAVDDDQVGATELRDLLLVGPVAEASSHDLFRGPHVVVAQDLFHVEVPVVALLGQSVLEDHHRADVVGALEVTHVEALDAKGRLDERQRGAQFLQGPGPDVVIALASQRITVDDRMGVVLGQFEGAATLAALGRGDFDRTSAQPTQVLAHQGRGRRILGHQHHRWHGLGVAVQIGQEAFEDLGVALVHRAIDQVDTAPDHPTEAHAKTDHGGATAVTGDGQHVEIRVVV